MTTAHPVQALGAAVVLGVAADLLLGVFPWGVNLAAWLLLLLAAGAALARRAGRPVASETPWLALTALLLAAAFARHDAPDLRGATLLTLLGVLGCTALATRGLPLRQLEPFAWIQRLAAAAGATAIGAFPLTFTDVGWGAPEARGPLRHAPAIGAGVVLAVPLLLVFGALFASADAVFAKVVDNLLDPERVLPHVLRTVFAAALVAGWLRYALLGRAGPQPAAPRVAAYVPVATALWLVNALFLMFVVVQLRYLFGGPALVESTLGLTYAEYARQGFFELVAASGLVLPVLVGAEWAVRGDSPARRRVFRLQAGLLLGLVGVIVASALERMRLYVAAFGMSTDRLYATAAEIFLLGVFTWFAATTLRDRPQRFAFGALLWGLGVLGGLHVLSPDGFVAHWNLRRPAAEREFDAAYAARLSADAAPALFAGLERLAPAQRCVVARGLIRWNAADQPQDWRTWNLARARARRLAREQAAALHAACVDVPDEAPAPESGL